MKLGEILSLTCEDILNQECLRNQTYCMIKASRDLLLFQIKIMKQNTLQKKFLEVVNEILPFFKLTDNKNMNQQAKTHLDSALENLEKGLQINQKYVNDDSLEKIILPGQSLDYKGQNYLVLHLKSRDGLIQLKLQYIRYLTQELQKNSTQNIYIKRIYSMDQLIEVMQNSESKEYEVLIKTIHPAEIKESQCQGETTMCEIDFLEPIDLSASAIVGGLGKIGGGIAALVASAIPLIGVLCAPVGTGLIVDGVIEIITFIITRQDKQFNIGDCLKNSFLDVALFGLGKLFKVLKIFKRLGKLAAKNSSKISKCNFLGKFSSKLGKKLQHFAQKLKKIKPKGVLKARPKVKISSFANLGFQLVKNTQLLNQVLAIISQFIKNNLIKPLSDLLHPLTQKFQEMQHSIKTSISNCIKSILPQSLSARFISMDLQVSPQIFEQITQFFQNLSNKIQLICDKVTSKFRFLLEIYHDMNDFFELGVDYYFNPIIDLIKSITKDKLSLFSELKNICSGDFVNGIIDCIKAFKQSIASLIDKVTNFNLITDIEDDLRQLSEFIFNMPQFVFNIFSFEQISNALIAIFCCFIGKNPFKTFLSKFGLSFQLPKQVAKKLLQDVGSKVKSFMKNSLKKSSSKRKSKEGESSKQEDRKKLQKYYGDRKQNDCVIVAIKLMLKIQSNPAAVYTHETQKGLSIAHARILLSRLFETDVKFEQSKPIYLRFQDEAKIFLNNLTTISGVAFMSYKNKEMGHAYCIEKSGTFMDHQGPQSVNDRGIESGIFLSVRDFDDAKRKSLSEKWSTCRKRCRQFDQVDQVINDLLGSVRNFGAMDRISDLQHGNRYPSHPRIIAGVQESCQTLKFCKLIYARFNEMYLSLINNTIDSAERKSLDDRLTRKVFMIGVMKISHDNGKFTYLCALNGNSMQAHEQQIQKVWQQFKEKTKLIIVKKIHSYDTEFHEKLASGQLHLQNVDGQNIQISTRPDARKFVENFKPCAAQQLISHMIKNPNSLFGLIPRQNGKIEMCEYLFYRPSILKDNNPKQIKTDNKFGRNDNNVIASCQWCRQAIPLLVPLLRNN